MFEYFFQVLTNGIKIDSSCVVQKPISQKVMLERTGELFGMIVIIPGTTHVNT